MCMMLVHRRPLAAQHYQIHVLAAAVAVKRLFGSTQFPQQNTKRIDIDRLVVRFIECYFGRHVPATARVARQLVLGIAALVLVFEFAGESKVKQFENAVLVETDIVCRRTRRV